MTTKATQEMTIAEAKATIKQMVLTFSAVVLSCLIHILWKVALGLTLVLMIMDVLAPAYLRARSTATHFAMMKIESVFAQFGFLRANLALPFDIRGEETAYDIADRYSKARGLNPCLPRAMIKIESRDGKMMISGAGAKGHMQLMPATARTLCGLVGDDQILDPENNIFCGIKHIDELIEQYGVVVGLQVYNAGPNRVGKTKENIEYPHLVLAEMVRCQLEDNIESSKVMAKATKKKGMGYERVTES